MNPTRLIAALALTACAFATPLATAQETAAKEYADGRYPPPKAPADLKWDNLLTGPLADQWTGMSMAIDDPTLTTRPNPDRPGEYILHIGRRSGTGLIRSLKPYENFILEYEWRHLTQAPNAGGGKDPKTGEATSGNSGVLICHGPFPKPNSPYPDEGHEIQVCNLGNGSWYTSHGDTFTLPGSVSTAIPDPRFAVSHACGHRSMPLAFNAGKTGEWNATRVTCVDGVIQHEINGHLASALYRASPRTGYISFESEGAPTEFRNMRIHELAPDPDLLPKHRAPTLPGEMTCAYVTARKAMPLPQGDFILLVDAKAKTRLSALVTGLALPDTDVDGRVVLNVRNHRVGVTVNGRQVVKNQELTVEQIETHAYRLHLETGHFGHVLILTPVKE